MAFFEKLGSIVKDLGEKAGDVVESTRQKASEAIEIGKINGKIKEAQEGITEITRKIGEYIVQNHAQDGSLAQEVKDLLAQIAVGKQTIAQHEEEIVKLREAAEARAEKAAESAPIVSPVAASEASPPETPEEAAQEVVEQVTEEASAAQPEMIRCPKCGTMNDAGNAFCYKCGASLHEETQENQPQA